MLSLVSPPGLRRAAFAAAIALGAVLALGRTALAGAPAICVDSSSPTAPLDRRVAVAAMRAAGIPATVTMYDGSSGVSERFFRFLARGHCALVMGFPVDALAPDPPSGLTLTASYFRTGYILASAGRPTTLAAVPKGSTVGVGLGTVPNFYLVGYFGYMPPYKADVFSTQEQALDALVRGQVRYAMVWAPSLARYRTSHRTARTVGVAPLTFPHAAWSLAALYAPRAAGLARRFDAGVARLRADGSLAALSRPFQPEVSK